MYLLNSEKKKKLAQIHLVVFEKRQDGSEPIFFSEFRNTCSLQPV